MCPLCRQAEKLLDTLKPPAVARSATGAGSGSGYEILLQVGGGRA